MAAEVHEKPLTALCRMMLMPEKYVADMGDKELEKAVSRTAKETCAKLAKMVAESVAKHLGLEIKSGEYLFRSGRWMNLGPLVDMAVVHKDWDSTPMRPGRPDTKEPTIKEIITRKWLPPSSAARVRWAMHNLSRSLDV